MAYKKGILLGQITKTAGFDGTVIIKLEKDIVENIQLMESVFLEIEGRPVPFFIASLDYAGGDVLKLSFTGYESAEKVSEFKGCRVFLTSGSGSNTDDEKEELTGFTVLDQTGKRLGIIAEIIENPGQWLLRVEAGKNEYLVPLHEDLIISINKKKKVLVMDIPEGITDL